MIDYDDMNEVLGREEKELAEEEARRQQMIAGALSRDRSAEKNGRPGVYSPDFSGGDGLGDDPDDDSPRDDTGYDLYMTIYEGVKNNLEIKLESARKDYDGVDREKKNELTDLLGTVFGFLVHTGGYPLIFSIWGNSNVMTFVSFGLLGIFWAFYVVKFFKKVLTEYANYRIRCSDSRVSPVIEEHKILTYEKERDIALEKIRMLKGNLEKLENFRTRIEKKGFLTESQCEAMRSLGLLSFADSPYKFGRIRARDYFSYLLHRR